jgi:hypothetical protein
VPAAVAAAAGDAASLLAEDPLRVLRCVRFVAVLGLRLAPATAAAVKAHAHLCSTQHGAWSRGSWLFLDRSLVMRREKATRALLSCQRSASSHSTSKLLPSLPHHHN